MNTHLSLKQLPAPDRHDPQPLILYHARCADGFGAALAAWLFYKGQAEFRACDHGEVRSLADLPPLEGRSVYILDFSFERELLAEMEGSAGKLVMLDHHKSAAQKLTGFSCRCGGVLFDMQHSGAWLAWTYFQNSSTPPALIRHIEDRDLWRWSDDKSAAFLAALDMEPLDFERWAQIAAFTPEQLQAFMQRGQAMDERFVKLAEDIAGNAQPIVFNGQSGLMVNAPGVFHSLVGELLSKRCGTFALMWNANPGGVIKVGLRSQKDFDCIPLAESMGGGGHAQACGFRMTVQQLPQLLSGQFTA